MAWFSGSWLRRRRARHLLLHAPVDVGGELQQDRPRPHRDSRAGVSCRNGSGKRSSSRLGMPADVIERRRRRKRRPSCMTGWISGSPALIRGRGRERQQVAGHPAVGVVAPPHLLAAGPGRFVLRALAPRQPGIVLQFVNAIDRRHVGRRRQARADADAVDRRAGSRECSERIFIETAADKDRRFLQSAGDRGWRARFWTAQ